MAWAAIEPEEYNGVGPRLAIGCSKAEQHLCQQIPGCNIDKADSIWKVPLTWPAYVAFRTVWASQPVGISPALEAWGTAAFERTQQAYQNRAAMDAPGITRGWIAGIEGGPDDQGYIKGPGYPLLPFQRGGVHWLIEQERAILGDPQGNGKTPQLIRALQVAEHHRGGSLPALVICPGASLLNWERELNRWAPEFRTQVVAGTALKRRKALTESGDSDVYLIAWPNVRQHTRLGLYPGQAYVRCDDHGGSTGKTVAQCEVHEKELNAIPFVTIIADEAHRMGDPKSKQTRAVWHLAHGARYFWPATGTITGDTIAQVWPVLHGIDPKGWPSRSRYLDLYAVKNYLWNGGVEILDIRPDTAAAYHASVQPLIRRVPKELARPQMPPRLPPVFRYPEMSPAQARPYRQLAKEMLADLEGAVVVPANYGVRFSRLCQLACSGIEVADGEDQDGFTQPVVGLTLPSSKVDDLVDFLDDNPGSLVVAANSPKLVELAERKLSEKKITNCKVVGGMSNDAQDQSVLWFQEGKCRVIFITAAGAEAITLTAADTIYFMQPDPVYLSREQKIGRVDRIGQRSAVRVVYSIAPGTVEERLYKLSEEKQSRAEAVTRDADLLRWMIAGDGDRQEAMF
jgi:hypothetical protein